jgi:hypothetical protein
MSYDLNNAKLSVRHVEDTETPEDAYEGKKRPDNTGFVELGVEIDGYFHPLASVKAPHFLEKLTAAREAQRASQPEAAATTPGWNQ